MVSKKEWGPAIWFLFHTLAYKLNNDGHVALLMNQILRKRDEKWIFGVFSM